MPGYKLSHAILNRTRQRSKVADGAGLYFIRNGDGSLTPWQRRRLPDGTDRDVKVTAPVMGEVDAAWLQRIRGLAWKMREGAEPADSKITFVEGWELYFGQVKKWSPRTRDQYDARIRKWLGASTLFKTPLPKITTALVIEAMANVRRELPHSAPLVLTDIVNCFKWLKATGAIASNPAMDYRDNLALVETRPRSGKHPALTDLDELRKLVLRLKTADQCLSLRSALLLQAFTALRTSEVLKARWPELDLDTATWRIPRGRMKEKGADRPAYHEVALHPLMVAMLRDLPRDSDLVFPAKGEPTSFISNTQAGRAYQRLGYDRVHVPHGWRAALQTNAEDATDAEGRPRFADRWIQDVLDHRPPGVKGHYRRDQKTVEGMRRVLLWWGDQFAGGRP